MTVRRCCGPSIVQICLVLVKFGRSAFSTGHRVKVHMIGKITEVLPVVRFLVAQGGCIGFHVVFEWFVWKSFLQCALICTGVCNTSDSLGI